MLFLIWAGRDVDAACRRLGELIGLRHSSVRLRFANMNDRIFDNLILFDLSLDVLSLVLEMS
jgi:hypothetical protein